MPTAHGVGVGWGRSVATVGVGGIRGVRETKALQCAKDKSRVTVKASPAKEGLLY
jgi:hypothetical protein